MPISTSSVLSAYQHLNVDISRSGRLTYPLDGWPSPECGPQCLSAPPQCLSAPLSASQHLLSASQHHLSASQHLSVPLSTTSVPLSTSQHLLWERGGLVCYTNKVGKQVKEKPKEFFLPENFLAFLRFLSFTAVAI